jgi:hypothetical protein
MPAMFHFIATEMENIKQCLSEEEIMGSHRVGSKIMSNSEDNGGSSCKVMVSCHG